jgi:hypothetical protein
MWKPIINWKKKAVCKVLFNFEMYRASLLLKVSCLGVRVLSSETPVDDCYDSSCLDFGLSLTFFLSNGSASKSVRTNNYLLSGLFGCFRAY